MTASTSSVGDLRFVPVGDSAVLVEFPGLDADAAWHRVQALDARVNALDVVSETCPGLVNLLLRFDPLVTDHDAIEHAVRALPTRPAEQLVPAEHVLDVRYGGADGFDLDAVASATGLSADGVAAAHAAAAYQVRMYGFAPGYAYLGGVPPELRLPRKPTAVRDVAAGSVIIANDLCLVTTLTMPTGWWVIGRCSTPILTPHADRPARFAVGDSVRFRPIGDVQ